MKFLVFADNRGNDPNNPTCNCGVPSKRQVASREKGRKIHYVCRLGKCNFYNASLSDGGIVTVERDDLVSLLAMLRII